ncbi:hypothetical protein [Rhizobium sp. MHM7A]|uniref:hypothetical protein n=1 Tax=Rhizobium sp. MHM7A TaxID=2583233 RepID=UPI0011072B6F|nr:hypothetical protein [Rhizobium sp. MHM7A]TLX16566.1 hypothetical protein FFR93_04300 [Rhizobium sp. MHM7A]
MNAYLAQYPQVEGTEDFTPERLRAIAAKWDAVMEQIEEGNDPVPGANMSLAHHRAEQARGIADYMEREGISSCRNIGCFQLDSVNKGDVVRLRKGIVLGSLHPKDRKNNYKKVNGVTRNISVHRCEHGYTDNLHKPHKAVVAMPRVVWAGTDGYWMDAKLDDIEIISRAA